MALPEYDADAREVRTFALVQLGLTTGFLVLLFWMLGATDADLPPIWAIVVLLVAVAAGAFLAERVWLSAEPLDPAADPEDNRVTAVSVYAGHTVRKLIFCEAPLLLAVLFAFVLDAGGWPILIAGVPGLAVLAWEVWPSLRNVAMTATMLDAEGAESELVDSFI